MHVTTASAFASTRPRTSINNPTPADVVSGWGRPRATSATEMWSNSPRRLDRLTRRLARCSRFDVESQQSDLQLMLHGGDTENSWLRSSPAKPKTDQARP